MLRTFVRLIKVHVPYLTGMTVLQMIGWSKMNA